MLWRDPVRARRTTLALLLLAALWMLAGCRFSPTPEPTTPTATATPPAPAASPTAPPTATPTPPAIPSPTPAASPTAEPAAWPTWELPAQGLRVAHPPTWTLTTPDTGAGKALLTGLSQGPWGPWSPPQAQTAWPESLVGVGTVVLDGLSGPIFLNVVPARLTLDAYATLLGDELARVDGVAVEEAQVVAGWRPRGLEVALVRGLARAHPGPDLRFWQVALLDEGGRQMLLVALTMPAQADSTQVETLLRRMVQQIEYREAAPR